jgi:DNA-binding MarR family transcriptional regulator
VRRFNRLVTQRVGALHDHFLGRDRPHGESRVLFEIGPQGADLRDVRVRLGLDSGYLSRLIQSLASQRLVKVSRGDDERVRRAQLTKAGLAEFAEMERRSDQKAEGILAELSESQRKRLVAAMDEVRQLFRVAGMQIERVDPASEIARWCVSQYFAELVERFDGGFDQGRTLTVGERDFIPPFGAFLVASVDGEAVACGALKTFTRGIGYLKRMWVARSVRGLGFGRRMLTALEAQARDFRMSRVRLETNRALVEAIGLYRCSGYSEVPAFNAEPYADYLFEKRLR